MKRVIALDPGGTTGWAVWTMEANGDMDWHLGQLGPEDHHELLYALLERETIHDFTVVCESFEFRQSRQRDNINLMSREYIGIAKLYEQERKNPVVFQTAAMAKSFVTDQKLKSMHLWHPGKKHAMDAMRHLVYYLVNKEKQYNLLESWEEL
jgi:hypothetical protein